MVFVFVLLTIGIFLMVDYVLRREGREIKEIGKDNNSPIFLSPEKALTPIENGKKRLYHLSHSWLQPTDEGYVYVGFDNFISTLFSSEVSMKDLPLVGAHVPQGAKIWDVGLKNHRISQLSPISGKVIDVNPACKLNVPIPTDQTEKSWILRIKADNLDMEKKNLMKHPQAAKMNTVLIDDLYLSAQEGKYLNDGGKIDPAFIDNMPGERWNTLIDLFFPYQQDLMETKQEV
jgi:glycine cleavage system H lipoate-binding protein